MSIEAVAARAANVAIYWRLIAASNANDLENVSALLDPNLIYSLPGRSPVAAHTQGVAAHLDMLRRVRRPRSRGSGGISSAIPSRRSSSSR